MDRGDVRRYDRYRIALMLIFVTGLIILMVVSSMVLYMMLVYSMHHVVHTPTTTEMYNVARQYTPSIHVYSYATLIVSYGNGTNTTYHVTAADPITPYFFQRLYSAFSMDLSALGSSLNGHYGFMTTGYAVGGVGVPYYFFYICVVDLNGNIYCGHPPYPPVNTKTPYVIINDTVNPVYVIAGPVKVAQFSSTDTLVKLMWVSWTNSPSSDKAVMYIPINVTVPAGSTLYVQWRMLVSLPQLLHSWEAIVLGGVFGLWDLYEYVSANTEHAVSIQFADGHVFRLAIDRPASYSPGYFDYVDIYPALEGINVTTGLLSRAGLNIYYVNASWTAIAFTKTGSSGYFTLTYQAYMPTDSTQLNATRILLMATVREHSAVAGGPSYIVNLDQVMTAFSIPYLLVSPGDYLLINYTFVGTGS